MRVNQPLAEPIKLRRVVDQDASASRLVGRPVRQEVEQDRVIGLGIGFFGRVRPVAAPDHSLGRRLDMSPGDLPDIGVGRRAVRLAQLLVMPANAGIQ